MSFFEGKGYLIEPHNLKGKGYIVCKGADDRGWSAYLHIPFESLELGAAFKTLGEAEEACRQHYEKANPEKISRTIQFDQELNRKLQKRAVENDRSVQGEVTHLLRVALTKNETKEN